MVTPTAPAQTEVLDLVVLEKSDPRHDLIAGQQRDALRALLLLQHKEKAS